MKLMLGVGWVAVAALAFACSGKIANVGSDGGEVDAQVTGSSGANSSSGASGSGVGSSSNSGGSGNSGGPGGSGSVGGDDAGDFDAGVDCGRIPVLHPNPPGDIYCGYGDDGGVLDCLASAGEGMCCLGGSLGNGTYAAQVCSPNAMVGCPNGGEDAGGTPAIQIQCNQISDCTANGFQGAGACCLQGAAFGAVPGCGYMQAKAGTAIVCEGNGGQGVAPCLPGEVQICSSNADCPQGTTCMPGKWKIFQLGICQ
jgi:hypothetical protein